MIRAIISFLASVLTAVQGVLLYTGEKGLCLNDGCAIVDSMTKVSPLVFNIAGFVFFQVLFWLFWCGRKGAGYWHKLARLLLLAGLSAEAVLVFFQQAIATVFCSYCLVIFAIIVLLNICCGLLQLFRGLVIFAAVFVTCLSLQFSSSAGGKEKTLDSGSMAMLAGKQGGAGLYLFFSSTCSHCEKVIEAIGSDNICSVRFNPIDEIEQLQVTGATIFPDYDIQVNRSLLQTLSIKEIPVLLAMTKDDTRVLKGEKRIRDYLDENCRPVRVKEFSGVSSARPSGYSFLPGSEKPEDDACAVDTDCDTPPLPGVGGTSGDSAKPLQ
ncbi:MAG: hypothetical protein OEL83_13865 [Desulforhopalus sp.]|nr:hypothetical protein [Desulforhopalus sp.]